jgi:serine/threonine protein kinase
MDHVAGEVGLRSRGRPERSPIRADVVGRWHGVKTHSVLGRRMRRIARAVASALDYAHRQNVIHRDIKPANILLHDGEPVVADFGIALAVQQAGGGRLTETGLSLGTPYYMSPEQATADRDPGPRSDVYSLGCVLYEMLAGEPPFQGGTAQAVLGRILTGDVPSVTEVRKTVPRHVDAAITRALQRLPADRFASGTPWGHRVAAAPRRPRAMDHVAGEVGLRSRGRPERSPIRHGGGARRGAVQAGPGLGGLPAR